jgi:lincosamide nucleotidyltransferase A/C/D/E
MTAENVIEVVDALERAGVVAWVEGGWGVDALLEEQTREHDDLDLVLGVDHVPALVVVLARLGFAEVKTWPESPEVFVMRAPDDRRVDVHPVRFDANGDGVQRIEGGRTWAYPADGFTAEGSIGGRRVRCQSARVQVLCHAGYELVASDAHDLRALRDRFDVELSAQQERAVASLR